MRKPVSKNQLEYFLSSWSQCWTSRFRVLWVCCLFMLMAGCGDERNSLDGAAGSQEKLQKPGEAFVSTEPMPGELRSGLQQGDKVTAWEPVHLTGPEAGTKNCPVCTHLQKPAVLAFASWTPNTQELARELDQLVTDNLSQELKAFLVVSDGETEAIKQFASSNILMNLSICSLDPKTRQQDLAKYKIDPSCQNTIIVYRDFTVWSNHVDMKYGDFATLSKSVTQLLARPREMKVDSVVAKPEQTKPEPAKPNIKLTENSFAITSDNASVTFIGTSGESSQEGHFESINGKLTCPSDDPLEMALELHIDMKSAKTDFELLTKHLKSEDFLDVEAFPISSFVSKRINRGDEDGRFSIVGDLTVHEKTNEIEMAAKISIETDRISVDGSFVIEQSQFGMNETPGETVDGVPVTIKLTLDRGLQD